GGYDDWLRQSTPAPSAAAPTRAPLPPKEKTRIESDKTRKLSFKELRELESLPDRIASLEEEVRIFHEKMADPDFYRNAGADVSQFTAQLHAVESELEKAYARWEELEAFSG
ncbi:MAG TPA: ABC transporter ATP-binding protein, partial [bacterium]